MKAWVFFIAMIFLALCVICSGALSLATWEIADWPKEVRSSISFTSMFIIAVGVVGFLVIANDSNSQKGDRK